MKGVDLSCIPKATECRSLLASGASRGREAFLSSRRFESPMGLGAGNTFVFAVQLS